MIPYRGSLFQNLPCNHVLISFKKTCAAVNQTVEYLLFGLGFSMALLVATQVFFRYVLNSSLFWSEELARYILVWLSFLGATVAYYRNLHPGVDTLNSMLPQKQQHITRLTVDFVAMALAAVMVVSGTQFAYFVRTQISPALSIHKWIILTIIPLSGVIFFCYALLFFLTSLQQKKK